MDLQTLKNDPAFDKGVDDPVEGSTDASTSFLGAISRHVALLAAWIATCGSLFMSEVLNWQPCLLCWYQRILMYPLAVILAVGILRRDHKLHLYVLPFSVVGAGVSLYHYLLIKTDWLPAPACRADVPCTVDYLDVFGFINIPFLALTAFLIITIMMTVWALFQTPEQEMVDEPYSNEHLPSTALTSGFGGSRLAVVMIVVGVVLSFMLASTMV
jgi:disulfide bond formation protein DsbB